MTGRSLAFGSILLLAACSSASKDPVKPRPQWPPARPGYVNPILAENQLPGDPNFYDGREATGEQIEGYVDHISAQAGDTVQAMVSSDSAHQATWSLYRLGWYGGARARKVVQGGSFSVAHQAACPMTPSTGLIRCAWQPSFSFTVTSDEVSGLYLVKFVRDDGFTSFAPLVIKDNRPADILMQASVDTYQAYSAWHGESLYADDSGTIPGGMAEQVSFDRPYASDRGTGEVLRYEALFAAFLERYGYDVTYTTNPDVAAGGVSLLTSHGVFLSVGHDEYWSPNERAAVQGARDANVPVLFFGANVGYWKIRYEQATDPANPRIITCYKNFPDMDPDQGPGVTGRYRDPPINDPENGLVGTMYESYELSSGPMMVTDPSSFVFTGTGLAKGDLLPFMVGYEYDRITNNGATPPGTEAIAHSPVVDAYGRPSWSDAVVYHSAHGSLVFGAGSIEWAYGLGQPGVADPRVERMTANILQEALPNVLPVPAALENALTTPGVTFSLPMPNESVQTVATGLSTPTDVVALPDGSFDVVDTARNQLLHAGPATGNPVTVIAGDGKASNKDQYDNVAGAQARFNYPTAALALANGDIIVSDTYNDCLRRVSNDAAHTVTTVAGTRGKAGYLDGAGTAAKFKDPMGLALDPRNGDILVADSGNNRIRRVNTSTWAVTTEAGSGPGQSDGPALQARFTNPTAVAVAADGRIFIVSSGDWRVIMVGTDAARTAVTIAGGTRGTTDGMGDTASLAPQGGALWTGTALLVSEPAIERIREIVPGTDAASTQVQAFVGSGHFGRVDGTGSQVELASPLGMSELPNGGGILVANGGDGSVRMIRP